MNKRIHPALILLAAQSLPLAPVVRRMQERAILAVNDTCMNEQKILLDEMLAEDLKVETPMNSLPTTEELALYKGATPQDQQRIQLAQDKRDRKAREKLANKEHNRKMRLYSEYEDGYKDFLYQESQAKL